MYLVITSILALYGIKLKLLQYILVGKLKAWITQFKLSN